MFSDEYLMLHHIEAEELRRAARNHRMARFENSPRTFANLFCKISVWFGNVRTMGSDAAAKQDVVRLDSGKLRALAHPLRFRILGALRMDGPSTSTELAQRLGTNTGKTSYHLRQLAAAGLVVEETARGNGRDRWWRSAHTGTSWSSTDFRADPDDRAADTWLVGQVARLHARWIDEWISAQNEWPDEWIDAADISDMALRLTPSRARELTAELHAVVDRYQETEAAKDDKAAERVTVLLHAFPNPEPVL